MEREEKALSIEWLRSKNLPFVLFREPGKSVECVIQSSPLKRLQDLTIKEKGFYVFPFSRREKAQPIFLRPDFHFKWEDRDAIQFNFSDLEADAVSEEQVLRSVNKKEYISDLEKYLQAFSHDDIKKAIYSRVKQEKVEQDFQLGPFFNQLCSQYPKAFIYLLNIPGEGIWMGASPELLLSYHDEEAKTVALAGTLKINKNLPAPEWTRKEIDEHRMVENHIIEVCESMELEYVKSPVRSSSTGKVYHLKSDFILKIDKDKIGTFLKEIHPTPAISGLPKEKALDLIYGTENYERGYYCGYLGWVEDPEDFSLYINLRCMKKIGSSIYLFAGGGITADSDIQKEWEETEVKMTTISDLLPGKISYSI